MADGLRSGISELTLEHLLEYLDGILAVSEEAIAYSVRRLAQVARGTCISA